MSLKELSTRLLSEPPFSVNVFVVILSSSGKVCGSGKGSEEELGQLGLSSM